MNAINGTDILLYVNDPTDGIMPFACGRTCTFDPGLDLIEVTNYAGNGFREYRANLGTWAVSADGIVIQQNYSYSKILRDQKAKIPIYVQFSVPQGDGGGVIVYEGWAYILRCPITGQYNEAATYSVSLQGTGAYADSSIDPPPPSTDGDMRLEYTVVSSTDTQTFPELVNRLVLEVFRGSAAIDQIITTGTPTGNQVKVTSALGIVQTAATNPWLDGETGYIIYR